MNIIRSLFENRVNSISILLDRSNQTYHSGELITGRLVFSLNESIDQNNLELLFNGIIVHTLIQINQPRNHTIGKSTVGSTTTIITSNIINNNNHHHRHHHHHQNREHSVNENFELFRQIYQFAPNGVGSKLGPGNHELPFQFVIPINLPSSFQYKRWAFIEYRLKASVGGKTKELDIQLLGSPSVSPNELYSPVQDDQSKTVGLFNGKKLTMRCNIPQAGWTMGSTIPLTCFIDNYSDKLMTLSASIKQDIQISDITHREKILTTFGQQVAANRIGGQYHIQILLPKALPVIHNTCRVIQINYYIEVKLDIPLAINLYCKLPIILTNQQLNQQQQQQPQPVPNFYPQPGQQQQYSFGQQPGSNPNMMMYPPLDPNAGGGAIPSAPPIGFNEAPPPYSENYGNNSQPIAPYPILPMKD